MCNSIYVSAGNCLFKTLYKCYIFSFTCDREQNTTTFYEQFARENNDLFNETGLQILLQISPSIMTKLAKCKCKVVGLL